MQDNPIRILEDKCVLRALRKGLSIRSNNSER